MCVCVMDVVPDEFVTLIKTRISSSSYAVISFHPLFSSGNVVTVIIPIER